MADQYSPAFSHPSFIQSDYRVFGAGITYGPSQLVTNAGSPSILETFKERASGMGIITHLDLDLIGNTFWSSQFDYIVEIRVDTNDWIRAYITFQTGTGITDSKFRFAWLNKAGSGGVLTGDTTWGPGGFINLATDGILGSTLVVISFSSEYGAQQANFAMSFQNSKHSLMLNSPNVIGYPFASPNDEWYGKFTLNPTTHGNCTITDIIFLAGSHFLPDPILSIEAWGQPTIVATPPSSIDPIGIASAEAWGSPSISVPHTHIFPQSIPSAEVWGYPGVAVISTPYSALPPPTPAKEGDIRLEFDASKQYVDFILADRDLDRDDGLETGVLITLITDKYADIGDQIPDDSGYRGGWWGDSIPVVPDYRIGTKLWLLQRSKTTTEIPARAKEYLIDGFKWMVEDGIVQKVVVDIERRRDLKTTLAIVLSFVKPEGTTIFYKFFYNWEAQLLRRQ